MHTSVMQVWVRLMIEEDVRELEFKEMLWYSVKGGMRIEGDQIYKNE